MTDLLQKAKNSIIRLFSDRTVPANTTLGELDYLKEFIGEMINSNELMIREIIEVADEVLNQWEMDFIESIDKLPDKDGLSEKQQAVLEKIYKKVCDSPY